MAESIFILGWVIRERRDLGMRSRGYPTDKRGWNEELLRNGSSVDSFHGPFSHAGESDVSGCFPSGVDTPPVCKLAGSL